MGSLACWGATVSGQSCLTLPIPHCNLELFGTLSERHFKTSEPNVSMLVHSYYQVPVGWVFLCFHCVCVCVWGGGG